MRIPFYSLFFVANASSSCIPSHFYFTGEDGTINSFRAKIIHDSTYKEIVKKCEGAGMNLPEPMTQEFNNALVEFWVSNDRWMGDLPVGIAADWKALSSGEPALFNKFKSPRPIIGQIDHYAVMNKKGEWHADTNEDRVFSRALCLVKDEGTKFEGHSVNVTESHDPCFGEENCETFINSCETYPIPSDKISTINATVNFKSSIDIQCSHGMPKGRWLNIFHMSAGGEIGQPGDRFFAAWRFPHDERLHFALGAPEGGFAKYKNLNCVDGEWNKYTLEQRQVADSLNVVELTFSRDDEVLLTEYYGVKDVFTGSVDVFLSRRPSLREIASEYAVRNFYYQKFPEIKPEECTNRSDPCEGLENCQTFIDSCTSNPSTNNKIGTIVATTNFRTAIDIQCTHGMSKGRWLNIFHMSAGGEIGKPGDRFFAAWRFPNDERLHFALGVPEGGFAKYQNLNCNDGEWNTYVLEQKQDQNDPNVVLLTFSIDGNRIASYTYATSAVLSGVPVDVFSSRRPQLREIAWKNAVRNFYYQEFPEIKPEECTNGSDPCEGLENCETYIYSCKITPIAGNQIATTTGFDQFKISAEVRCTNRVAQTWENVLHVNTGTSRENFGDRYFAIWKKHGSSNEIRIVAPVLGNDFDELNAYINCEEGWHTFTVQQTAFDEKQMNVEIIFDGDVVKNQLVRKEDVFNGSLNVEVASNFGWPAATDHYVRNFFHQDFSNE